MEDHVQIHPSASQEAIDYLVDAGVGRAQAEALLRPIGTEQSLAKPNEILQGETPRLEALEERMCSMMESFSQRLDQLAAKIGDANDVAGTSTGTDHDANETPDYNVILHWPDEEDANGQSLVEVSDPTATLLSTSFSKPLANATRLSLKKSYPIPKVHHTKCPKMDRVYPKVWENDSRIFGEAATTDRDTAATTGGGEDTATTRTR